MVKVTVLMSVYNGGNNLRCVMDSVENQTFKDYEFLIINDGSTDNSLDILREYAQKDERIRLVDQDNIGLTRSLNKGIVLAKGAYIARQDADDLSKKNRLATQLNYFETFPDVNLVGSNSEDYFDDLGKMHEWGYFPENILKDIVFKRTPFPHSTAMMRTSVVRDLGGYNESYETTQDAELWMRFAKKGRILMCPETLIERHIHSQSISARKKYRQWRDGFYARMRLAPGGAFTALRVLLRQILLEIFPQNYLLKVREFKRMWAPSRDK